MAAHLGRLTETEYYTYYQLPLKAVPTPGGGGKLWRLSPDTGGWDPEDSLVYVEFSNPFAETSVLNREKFIQLTEADRAYYLRGEGPIFALYDTIKAVEGQAEAENRPLTATERALIAGLRRKTYAMFERELARRGEPGADPSPED